VDTLLLQDWVTVADNNPVSTGIAQSAASYLDISEYQDLVFFLNVTTPIQGGPLPQIEYQTAPVAEESAFLPMLLVPSSFTGGPRADAVLGRFSRVPPAKYVRWFCGGNGYTQSCTFSIWVAGYRLP
jgi:hypothetical protein